MKRISILVMALALVTTLAQCKKTETPTNDNEGRKVHITLDVSSDSKVIVTPETGGTAFEQGDVVLVANGGHYVGTLTYDQSLRKFDGDLDEGLSTADYLHFYLLGNKDTEENLNDALNRPTTLTVNISDQTASYPEIAYAHSTVKYTDGVTAYTARLLNKCALVKFTTDNIPTTVAVTITGMNNQVSVNLSSNSFTYSKVGEGAIALHAESETERWSILLPQDAVTGATALAVNYAMTEAFNVPIINENDYLNEGIAVNLVYTAPVGAINGKFTINGDGGKVYFSKGNLQYIGSAATPYWQFAEHQWDYLGTTTSQNSTTTTVDRDLFGWGSSGYDHGANAYQPWRTSTNSSDYYAYGNSSYNLTGQADWGYNAISNGGNTENSGWRTLTGGEWDYVFNTRSSGSTVNGIVNARYTEATINTDGIGVNGMILFPDGVIIENSEATSWGTVNGNSAWGTQCTTAQWTALEAKGCVFLPAAGRRSGTSLDREGSYGYYWSSSYYNSDKAYYAFFYSSYHSQQGAEYRNFGYSVRLVRNVVH